MPGGKDVPERDVLDAIELTNFCQALNALPRAGGVLDQDSYHVWLIKQVLNAQYEKSELDRPKTPQGKTGRVTTSRH